MPGGVLLEIAKSRGRSASRTTRHFQPPVLTATSLTRTTSPLFAGGERQPRVCPPLLHRRVPTHVGDNHSDTGGPTTVTHCRSALNPRVIGRLTLFLPLSPFPKLVYHRRITGNYASRAPLPQPGSSFISRTSPGAETLGSGRGNTVRSCIYLYISGIRGDRKKERATRIRSFSFRPPATPPYERM